MTTVALSDAQINLMISNPAFRKAFPFLDTAYAQSRQQKKGCGDCGGGPTRNTLNYQAVRNAVSNLTPEDKRKLKRLLGADTIEVKVTNKGNTAKLLIS